MQVILLEHIRKLGKLGDLVNVKSGFARNYLIPFGKADSATKGNLLKFEECRAELEAKANSLLSDAKDIAGVIEGVEVTISALASEEGKLYGSIGPIEICDAIVAKLNVKITKADISLPGGPIHSTGEAEIVIQLHGDVKATVKLLVKPEDAKK